ncbi:putative 4-hydroxybenzoyl-CoA reductase, beta subunit [uncultured Desulfobacterium sp.]|uniref:Putative 4-hydroxybenzoyl-CoA reductase, beta subunit n=1 Tax=uncultured Desulfobacterium sp. TaxID=201089 RepID=A0A445MXL7_9BACT|nr:putative 4-hydroxybenzoyl-CoA reductase, beta subunit [uncultured Desulfobacterium sp.]
MSLPRFEYEAPKTLDEAISLLSEAKKDTKVIAGGTDLVVAMKQRRITPAVVVNIKGIKGLEYIENGKGDVRIGALTPLNSIEESELIKERFPGLSKAAGAVGAPQHRNAGTIGGNICLNTRCWYYNQSPFFRKCRPVCYKFGSDKDKCQLFPTREGKANVCYSVFSGDTAPVLIALGARVKIKGPAGERTIPLTGLYTGDGKRPVALSPAEIVTEVTIPVPPKNSSSAYMKYRIREAIDFPLLGVAVKIALESKAGACKNASVVLGAVASRPVEVGEAEKILKGKKITDELIEQVAEAAFKTAKPLANLLECSPQYRKRLARIFTKRAINSALESIKSA